MNSWNYYSIDITDIKDFNIKVTDTKKSVVEYEGRKVYLSGKIPNVQEGTNYLVHGSFKKDRKIEEGIIGTIYINKYTKLNEGIYFQIFSFQENIYSKLKDKLGEEGAAIVSSSSFGNTTYLKKEQNEEMNKLGIVHVISVSGFHLAVLYTLLEKVLGFKITLVISFFYLIFTGGKPPTLRAFIMIAILKFSKKLYRNYDAISSLCFSALLLIFYKPYYIYDLGFILSYLSTLGIILFYEILRRKLYMFPEYINNTISISLSAQVFTFPVVILTINTFSPNFLWGNLLILPIFTGIVILGNIALVVIWNPLLFNLCCYGLKILLIALNGGITIINWFSLPIVYMNSIICYHYCSVLICFFMTKKGFDRFKLMPIALTLAAILSIFSFYPKLTYINSRFEKGILIEYGFHRLLLTDVSNAYYLENMKKEFQPTEVLRNYNKSSFKVGKNIITFNDNGKSFWVICSDKKYFLTENKENKTFDNYYDIIKLNENNNITFRLSKDKLTAIK
ncbi:competence protein ComEC [Clostridium polyendosporum]|uniref:Competence protein ComEC n=2 Tax=Clostridium polyendosporum TaxID=69208 RepID=A0A919RYW0_9CLOT|nr:competence protein ComEC [Clostridium polyendosporum]